MTQEDIEWSVVPDCLRDRLVESQIQPQSITSPLFAPSLAEKQPTVISTRMTVEITVDIELNNPTLINAATTISKFYRMYRARKWFQQWRHDELVFLGAIKDHPCISRATRKRLVQTSLKDEAFTYFISEEKKRNEDLATVVERELQISFLEPTQIGIWKFFEANGEFPSSINDLLLCIDEKGNLLKPITITEEPKGGNKSNANKSGKKKQTEPTKATQQQKDDPSLTELIQAVRDCKVQVGLEEIDREAMVKATKDRMIRQVLEPALHAAAGRQAEPAKESMKSTECVLEELSGVIMEFDRMTLDDLYRDKDTIEDTWTEARVSRTCIISRLIEDIVLPLGTQYVFSRCGLPYRSLLLYGPAGCGKRSIVKMLACETNAVVVDFKEILTQSKDVVSKTMDDLSLLLSRHIPVMIYIDAVEKIFPPVTPKSLQKKPTGTRGLSQVDILTQVIEILKKGRGIIVGVCSDVSCDYASICRHFGKRIFVIPPTENERIEAVFSFAQSVGVSVANREQQFNTCLINWARSISNTNITSIREALLQMKNSPTASVQAARDIWKLNIERIDIKEWTHLKLV